MVTYEPKKFKEFTVELCAFIKQFCGYTQELPLSDDVRVLWEDWHETGWMPAERVQKMIVDRIEFELEEGDPVGLAESVQQYRRLLDAPGEPIRYSRLGMSDAVETAIYGRRQINYG